MFRKMIDKIFSKKIEPQFKSIDEILETIANLHNGPKSEVKTTRMFSKLYRCDILIFTHAGRNIIISKRLNLYIDADSQHNIYSVQHLLFHGFKTNFSLNRYHCYLKLTSQQNLEYQMMYFS